MSFAQRMNITPITGTFQVGETVTGGTSGATGIIDAEFTTAFDLSSISATQFTTTETVTGGTSGATATFDAFQNLIYQTGTDTDLSGLTNLNGVTTVSSDPDTAAWGQYIYIVNSSNRGYVAGTVTIEPDQEMLVLEKAPTNNTSSNPLIINGTLNHGVSKTAGGNTIYSNAVGLNLTNQGTNFFNYFGIYVTGVGTFNWNGGIVRSSGTFRIDNNGTFTVNKGVFYDPSNVDAQIRLTPTSTAGGANLNINDLVLDGLGDPSRFFTTWGFNNAVFTLRNGLVQQYNGNYPEQTYTDLKNGDNINTYDFQFENSQALRGANIIFNGVEKRINYNFNSNRYGYVKIFKPISLTPKDLTGSGVTFSYYGIDTDNGNRTIGSNDGGTDADGQPVDQDDTADIVYSGLLQTGTLSDSLLIETMACKNGSGTADDRTTSDTIPIRFIAYNEVITTWSSNLIGVGTLTEDVVMTPDLSITEAVKATVDAYTELETARKFYDRAKADLVDNYAGETSTIVGRTGSQAELAAKNLIIDATAGSAFAYASPNITVKSSTFTGGATATTGIVTVRNGALLSGGTFDCDINYEGGAGTTITNVTCSGAIDFNTAGTYTISGGSINEVTNSSGGSVTLNLINGATVTTNTGPSITVNTIRDISITGQTSTSRVQIYNVTTATEFYNDVPAGDLTTTYAEGVGFTSGDTVRIRVADYVTTTAKKEVEVTTLASANGFSALISQVNDDVYNTYAVDGSTITEFSFDNPNLEVDINDSDNTTVIQRLGAWYHYYITTADGIASLVGCLDWESLNSIKIDPAVCDLKLDNIKTTPLLLKGGRIYRTDGSTIISTTSNSIQVDYSPVYSANINDIWSADVVNGSFAGGSAASLIKNIPRVIARNKEL
jgi:hypothetical protein